MLKVALPINDKQKFKLKKNAMDFVDFEAEKKNDPKFKTELCKTFQDTNFCPYGNRCRFAHGKKELYSRSIDVNKYKQKGCNSFEENGFCLYGSRCNFKHGEQKLTEINRSYYNYLLLMKNQEEDFYNKKQNNRFENFQGWNHLLNRQKFNNQTQFSGTKRLDVFSNLTKTSESLSTSVSSNEDNNNNFSPQENLRKNVNFGVFNNNNFYPSQANFFPGNFILN